MLTTPKHKLYFKNTLYAPEHLFGPKVFVSSGENTQSFVWTKSFREFGGKGSSKINSIHKHLVRNDRGAIQKQHKTKHDLVRKMKSFGTRRSKRNLKKR